MTPGVIRATWLGGSTDATAAQSIAGLVESLLRSPAYRACQAYLLTGSPKMREVAPRARRIPADVAEPSWLVVGELEDLGDAIAQEIDHVALEEELSASHPAVTRGLYAVVDDARGPSFAGTRTLGPAVQFGCFDTDSTAGDWEVARWYHEFRMPRIREMSGAVRARRLCSLAGPTNFGVLYEFESLEARIKVFEPEDLLAFDPGHRSARIVDAVIHMPFSPSIGETIDAQPAGDHEMDA